MEISTTLMRAIEEKNVRGIHSVFYTIAHEDPAFATDKYINTLNYVKGLEIDGVLQKHNGSSFLPESEWSEEYWAQVVSELQDNFSQDRIEHLMEVGKKIYGKSEVIKSKNTGRSFKTSMSSENESKWLLVAMIATAVFLLFEWTRRRK